MHRLRALTSLFVGALRQHIRPERARFCEWAPDATESALYESDQRVLNLESTRRLHFGSVAFRYTKPMIDGIAVRPNLNVNDVHSECRKGSDERFENATLQWNAEFNSRKRPTGAIDERDQRFGDTQHAEPEKHTVCQRRKARSSLPSSAI